MGMEYRKVTPEEKMHVERLQSMVFSFSANEQEIREQIEKGEYKCDETYGAIDENGRVVAGMEVIPYIMWFDGHRVPMYGIGGVASMPESRRQGNIRKIFEKAFEDIRGQGAVFSHLFPFSYDYYRKFGYEHAGAARKYTLPLEYARKLENRGTAHEFIKGGGERGELIKIYEAYASRHNIMISRTSDRWDKVLDVNLFGADRLYYWRDAAGEIKSWVKFKKDGDSMQVHDIAWLDHESMLGALQFIGMFEGAAEKLKLTASPELIPDLYWNDVWDISEKRQNLGMNRVIDAKRALELMRKPDVEGRFSIRVTDEFAPWNTGTYAVEYGGGECAIKAGAGGADLEVSELALMQLVLGTFDFGQIARRADVRVNAGGQELARVFCRKNALIADYF